MLNLTKLLGALALAMILAATPAAAQKTEQTQGEPRFENDTIVGTWQVVGANARGATYRGRAAVRRVGDVYRVVWKIGRSTYWGVGVITGKTLSVAYNGGLAVYRITPNGLVGRWTTLRGTRLLTENWRR